MNGRVVLFRVNLEVFLQKFSVVLATICRLVSLLEFFQAITTNSAWVCKILNVYFGDLVALRHCLPRSVAVLG